MLESAIKASNSRDTLSERAKEEPVSQLMQRNEVPDFVSDNSPNAKTAPEERREEIVNI